MSTLRINIFAAAYGPNISAADPTNDSAYKDLENLMENIEKILRSHHNLGGTVAWQYPTRVDYSNARLNNTTHVRFAMLQLDCKVKY
jgi:hypothetical protein